MQIQGLRGYFSWNPTAFTIGYRPTAIRLGWKPIPSKARVTRDEVSGSIKHKGDSCLEDSTITHIDVTMSKRIIMQGTVFQTASFFLSLIPRLRPGLLSLRSVLASSQIYTNHQPPPATPQEAATVPTAFTVGYQPATKQPTKPYKASSSILNTLSILSQSSSLSPKSGSNVTVLMYCFLTVLSKSALVEVFDL